MTPHEGTLVCDEGHMVPVVDGVPRFTPASTYADSFGFEWTSFPELQLDDDANRESEETLVAKLGLGPPDVAGRLVLDVGCGMGRFSDVVSRWGGRVVGADLSRAVDAAARNLSGREDAAVIQADARDLPFAPGAFDVVFSIGVLHHTPSTFGALARISPLVKPGGTLAIWVYSSRLRWALFGGELLRPITSRMSPQQLLRLVRWIVPRAWALKRRMPALHRLVDLALPTSNHPDPEWRILDTFDWYSPRYQHKHTYAEVEGWFRSLGFEEVERLGVPVSVRGRRPKDPA